uniref:Photosystem I reaction center subunit IV n=1 Tax=Steinernema glaseri TaxID=37863 RepID=A0A1I8A5H9_9BILA
MTTRKVYEESEYYVKEFELRDGVGREFEERESWHRGTPTLKPIERPFRSKETTFNESIYSNISLSHNPNGSKMISFAAL